MGSRNRHPSILRKTSKEIKALPLGNALAMGWGLAETCKQIRANTALNKGTEGERIAIASNLGLFFVLTYLIN